MFRPFDAGSDVARLDAGSDVVCGGTAKWLVRKVQPLPDGTGGHDRARQAMGNTTDITLLPGDSPADVSFYCLPPGARSLAAARRAPVV